MPRSTCPCSLSAQITLVSAVLEPWRALQGTEKPKFGRKAPKCHIVTHPKNRVSDERSLCEHLLRQHLLQGLLSPPRAWQLRLGAQSCLPQPVLLKTPSFKWFPAWLPSWFGSASAVGAGGFLTRGLCLMGDPRALLLLEELNISHQVFEHPLLQMKSVGSCIHFKFQSPFSFDLHLVSRANSGKCLVSSSLAVSVILSGSLRVFGVFFSLTSQL